MVSTATMWIAVIATFLGTVFALSFGRNRSIGNLVITDDEDGTYMFLEINKADAEELRTKSSVRLKVVDKSRVPHK